MKILRYAWHTAFTDDERRDGYYVSQFCDIYMAGWLVAAIEGIHANGKKIISYKNFSGQTRLFQGDPNRPNPNWLPDAALLTESGDFINSKHYPVGTLCAMDPMNQEWRDNVVSFVQKKVKEGFDGVWADVAISVEFPYPFTYDARAVDPRTGQLYTPEDYVRDRVDMANYVQAAVPKALLIANGWYSGRRYYMYPEAYDYINKNLKIAGAFSEGAFAGAGGGDIYDSTMWNQSVQMIEDMQDKWLGRGKLYVVNSYCTRPASINNKTLGEIARFYYASLLMGVKYGGNVLSPQRGLKTDVQDVLDLDLGTPLGQYTQLPDVPVYQRTFTKYKVFVNISKNMSYDIEGYGSIEPLGTLFIEEATPILEFKSLLKAAVPLVIGSVILRREG